MSKISVTVWHEYVHEKDPGEKGKIVSQIYPKGIHHAIADDLKKTPEYEVRTATLEEPDHGLPPEVLAKTDVLLWWGHGAHAKVEDRIVDAVQKRVLEGMGLIVLHSGHYSKIFKRLLGTSCSLTWREAGEKERLWVCNPGHPIVQGLPPYFEIEHEEMYGEPFGIPAPDETLLISWFEGGEVFRSGATWKRGNGKIFYFRPGHETYPTYHHPQVQLVIRNAVKWCAPEGSRWIDGAPNIPVDKAPEKITAKGPTLHKPGEAGFR